ncbi:MAG: type 4a pilus biogenesis protein PilO, partial [Planctomycetaceae bacterium]|nr:type 4a pilus biogenesis protein PilO [Planctomycetaceae bacterium]
WFHFCPLRQQKTRLGEQAIADQVLWRQAAEIDSEHATHESELSGKRQLLDSLEQRVPTQAHESEFFQQIVHLSNQHDVQIHGFRPGANGALEGYQSIKVEFDASAEYEPLCRFLDGMAKMPRLNHITRLQVSPKSSGDGTLLVKIETNIYFKVPATNSGSQT